MDNSLEHHGILGMHWGIRRFQNRDGSLTPAGKKRLKRYNEYTKGHSEDFTIKKNTTATRVVGGLDSEYKNDPEYKKYYYQGIKERKQKEKELDTKYVSVDNVRNSGRTNGKEYYMSWFSDSGWDPDGMYVDTYKLVKDIRVASGQKVIDEVLKEIGKEKLSDAFKNESLKRVTLNYTQDKELFNRVNDKFKKQGYDAIEDINDPDTDLPIIILNAKTSLALKNTETGQKAIDNWFKEHKDDKIA